MNPETQDYPSEDDYELEEQRLRALGIIENDYEGDEND